MQAVDVVCVKVAASQPTRNGKAAGVARGLSRLGRRMVGDGWDAALWAAIDLKSRDFLCGPI